MSSDLSRRGLLLGSAGAFASALLVPGCASPQSQEGQKEGLTLVTWGGTTGDGFKRGWAEPYTKKTGTPVEVISPVDYSKLVTQIREEQVRWNWVDAETWFPFAHPDLLQELDRDIVTVEADDLFKPSGRDPVKAWGVQDSLYSFVISYRQEAGDRHPHSWAEFFDPKAMPGKRAIYNWPYGLYEAVLLGDGVPYEELYPLDVDRALGKLDQIRDHLVFWDSGAEMQQQLVSGQADFVYAWCNRVGYLAREGQPVAIDWAENIQDGSYSIVYKGDPQAEETMRFINFALQPEQQANQANYTGYSPSLKSAMDLIDEEWIPWLNTHPPNWEKAAGLIDAEYWGKHYDELVAKWNEWAGE